MTTCLGRHSRRVGGDPTEVLQPRANAGQLTRATATMGVLPGAATMQMVTTVGRMQHRLDEKPKVPGRSR
jgi:hypothetical protein